MSGRIHFRRIDSADLLSLTLPNPEPVTLGFSPDLNDGHDYGPIAKIFPDGSVRVPNWDRVIETANQDETACPDQLVRMVARLLLLARGRLVERPA